MGEPAPDGAADADAAATAADTDGLRLADICEGSGEWLPKRPAFKVCARWRCGLGTLMSFCDTYPFRRSRISSSRGVMGRTWSTGGGCIRISNLDGSVADLLTAVCGIRGGLKLLCARGEDTAGADVRLLGEAGGGGGDPAWPPTDAAGTPAKLSSLHACSEEGGRASRIWM
jgi:hypothetical protein